MKSSTRKWICRRMLIILIAMLMLVFCVIKLHLHAGTGYKTYESEYTLKSGYTFKNIQVCNMKDSELENKINKSLNSYFYILIEPWFREDRVRALEPIIHCQTDKYLSVEYIFEYTTAINTYWRQCVTVDMHTGEVVFLDDLIDLNEDFAELVKTGTILKNNMESVWTTPNEQTLKTNEYFSKLSMEQILKIFQQFTKEELYGNYNADNVPEDNIDFITSKYYHYFYLDDERIIFTSANSTLGLYSADTTYIDLDDIEDYLKVAKW